LARQNLLVRVAPDETGEPQTVSADLAGLQQAFGQVGRNEPCPCYKSALCAKLVKDFPMTVKF
jgi:hypothetical protein